MIMMSVCPKRIMRLLAVILIISSIISFLEGVSIELKYKLLPSNCNVTDIHVALPGASVGMCAALCTQIHTCRKFAWRKDVCQILKTCPQCLSPGIGDDWWSVYCLVGKIVGIICSTVNQRKGVQK